MDAHKLANQISQLQAASERISSVLIPQEVLNVITREFANLLKATTVTLSRLDETSHGLVVVSEYEDGEWLEIELGRTFMLSEYTFTASLLKQKEIKQIKLSDPEIEESEQALLEYYEMKSVLLIPFVRQKKLIGLVEIYEEEERYYSEEDLQIVKLLSSTAAVAFENATLIQQIQQRYQEQKTLHESAIFIASTLELSAVLDKISEQVCTLLDATSVYITDYDPVNESYCILAEAFGEYASEAERISDLGITYEYKPVKGIEPDPVELQQPRQYHIDDPGLEQRRYRHLRQFGGHSVLEIPLQASGKMNAIIMVWESRCKRIFSEQEIALCETIALQASIALENAMLYQQARDEIKQRKKLEKDLRHKALHDMLTHLPNRVLFFDRLDQAIKKKERNPQVEFAVFYIDLDNFKQVNDTFGHSEGDRILKLVAQMFQEITRETDTVSRFGGDEFLLLIEDIPNKNLANQFVKRIKNQLGQPLQINGMEFRLSCSIGYSLSSQGFKTGQEYIDFADMSMYRVKHRYSSTQIKFN